MGPASTESAAKNKTKATPRLAKLSRPFLGAAYARTRLFDLLDQPNGAPVVWVAGPPGSGKTTLIADYTARRGIDCLWYQIDRADADVASFFFYLTQAARERTSGGPLPQFQPEYLGDIDIFARNFFRDLFARLETPFLVLDNYQDVAADSALHAVMRDAFSEVPPGCHVVVVSRNDPPASFASLRAQGKLDVIGWNQLRLTPEECNGIAAKRGMTLTETELELLHARTQGWAVGVVLLLSDAGASGLSTNRNASATPAVIFDYVAEEIFKKFSPIEQEYLLRAGYLPQITLSMSAGLGLPEESRAAMRSVGMSEFLVTVRNVETEPIYQLHPLLREFLRARAEETGTPEEIEGRKRLAARVLAEHEHIEAAAQLLIRIRDWDGLKGLIAAHANTLLRQGRSGILESWIRALPGQHFAGNAWLEYWLGVCRFPYAPRETRELFFSAYRHFDEATPVDLHGVLAALNGALEAILHDSNDYRALDPWIEIANRRIRDVSEWPSADLAARLTSNLFMAIALRQPNHPDLAFWRTQTQEISQLQGDPNVRISIDAILAALSAWHGQFAGALRLIEGMRELAAKPDISPVSAVKSAQAEAIYHMLTGDTEKCLEAVERGLGIVARSGVRVWNETFLAIGLWGALAGKDLEQTADWLRRIEATPSAPRNFDSFMRAYGIAWQATLRGDAFLAHQHLKSAAQASTDLGLPGFRAFTGLALAQVLFDAGDERGADRELERAAAFATDVKSRLMEFMVAMCRASFALSRGQDAAAVELLKSGLALGRERGFTHFPWWLPQRMARLCQRALEAQIEPEYVRRVIERRQLMPNPPPYAVRNWPWRYRIQALGAFRAEIAGEELREPGKRSGRSTELLKAIVALGGRNVRLERLAETLWPKVDRDFSSRSLNTTLHRLRKLLTDDSAVIVQAGELRLNAGLFWLDTWGFERACNDTQALLRSATAPPTALAVVDSVHQAMNFYGGPLLADDAELRWSVAPREQYRSQLLRLLATASEILQKLGQPDDIVALYRLAVERERLTEALYRALMQALKSSGRVAEAIEVYHRCRSTLEAELKTVPSAATEELYATLISPRKPPVSDA